VTLRATASATASELVLTTFDWVPEQARGYVRDLRVRWALEEAGLSYRVEATSSAKRGSEHLARQPFGQVPWLTDGDLTLFESAAILLHLGERSAALLPREPQARAQALQWVFAASNSMEVALVPWVMLVISDDPFESPGARSILAFRDKRLAHLEPVLAGREWLAGGFSVADIFRTDALRLLDGTDVLAGFPASTAYVARATARPAFKKAHADQIAHFARGDSARAAAAR
jgi:glutathione S-transferase